MTDWFARPVLHVKGVDAFLRFYINPSGLYLGVVAISPKHKPGTIVRPASLGRKFGLISVNGCGGSQRLEFARDPL